MPEREGAKRTVCFGREIAFGRLSLVEEDYQRISELRGKGSRALPVMAVWWGGSGGFGTGDYSPLPFGERGTDCGADLALSRKKALP